MTDDHSNIFLLQLREGGEVLRSACLPVSVCLLAYLKNHMSKVHKIFCTLPAAVAWSYSGDNAICYVFLFSHNRPIQIQACSLLRSKFFTVID